MSWSWQECLASWAVYVSEWEALPLWGLGVVTLAILWFQERLLRKAEHHFKKTPLLWDDAALWAARSPLRYLVLTIILTLVSFMVQDASPRFHATMIKAFPVLIALVFFGFLWRFIAALERNALTPMPHRKILDKGTTHRLAGLARMVIMFLTILVIMPSLGTDITGLLTIGGVGGIVIGLAAQNMLSNFFGGMMLYVDQPFKVGEWIRSPDRNIEGVVEEIGWRVTRIRTFDKRPIYVPNAVFTTITLENPSRMTHRRILERIGVRYEDAPKLPAMLEEIRTYLRQHPDLDPTVTLWCHLVQLGDSSINFDIYAFTKSTDWVRYRATQEMVLLKIMEIIEKHGAQMAYPTTHIVAQKALPLQLLSADQSGLCEHV